MSMRTVQYRIRHDDAGITTGRTLYTLHEGERLIGAQTFIHVSKAWNGSTPTLTLRAGNWSAAFPIAAIEGDDLGDGLRFVAGPAIEGDVLATTYGVPLTVTLDDGAGGSAGSTTGTAWLVLTTLPQAADI